MARSVTRGRVALVAAFALVAGLLPAAASPVAAAPADAPVVAQRAPRTLTTRRLEHRGMVNARALAKAGLAPVVGERQELPFLERPALHAESPGRAPAIAVTTALPVPATQTTNPPLAQPVSWEGMTDAPATGFEPPDPWVGVGPEHVVQSVNTRIQIWNRTGGSKLAADLDAAQFFDVAVGSTSGLSDPRFAYDSYHGRWVGTAVSWDCDVDGIPVGSLDLLVSANADPTGAWDLWKVDYAFGLPDYPMAGWSTDKLGFASNLFELSAGSDCTASAQYAGADVFAVDWSQVLANEAELDGFGYLQPNEWTPRIATQFPAASGTLHIVALTSDFNEVTYVQFTGTVAADTIDINADWNLATEGVLDPFVEPPFPQQPGPDTVTERLDGRITDAIWKDNHLRFVATNGCTPTGDTQERACIHVVQLRTTGVDLDTVPTKSQDFLISESGADNFFGGIGVSGDSTLHVVWTRSSTTAPSGYPSSRHAYHLNADPANAISAPVTIAAGTGPYTGGRWGDYVGVAQDPQVTNAVWQANQYSGGTSWKTRVSELQTGGATYVPVTPARVLDTRYSIGLSGVFKANVPRTFQVAGVGAIPSNAIGVTGNVTVTEQTTSGFIAVTTTPTSTPGSSTINFPLGDNRANNVTAALRSDGRLAAVFKGGSGSADLIFDVTGYFLAGPSQAKYKTITPFRKIDSRLGIGMPGGTKAKFEYRKPRTFQIAGVGTIPSDAIAVTGNLTVDRQTRGGFLAITKDPVTAPSTSTLNFPSRDIRANGFTAPLNSTGKLSIVYSGARLGDTTDVILDLTGYYTKAGGGLVFHPLNPGRIFDTRTSGNLTGLTSMFTSKTPRQLAVTGHWGVAANAGAITGNLTVTGQQQGGYAGVTLTSQPVPSTSSLNFPVGDNRANGITVPLDGAGKTFLVYVSGAGTKTHLLLDVTGYFAP